MQKTEEVPPNDLLTSSEAMEVCQISRRTLERWVASGKLSFLRIPASNERRYHRSEVLRLTTPALADSHTSSDETPQESDETAGDEPAGTTPESAVPPAAPSGAIALADDAA